MYSSSWFMTREMVYMPMFGQLIGARVPVIRRRPSSMVSVCSQRLPVVWLQHRHVVLHCSDGCLPGGDLWDSGISSGRQPENRHQKGWLMTWTTGPGEDRAGVVMVGGGGVEKDRNHAAVHGTDTVSPPSQKGNCTCLLHSSEIYQLPVVLYSIS